MLFKLKCRSKSTLFSIKLLVPLPNLPFSYLDDIQEVGIHVTIPHRRVLNQEGLYLVSKTALDVGCYDDMEVVPRRLITFHPFVVIAVHATNIRCEGPGRVGSGVWNWRYNFL